MNAPPRAAIGRREAGAGHRHAPRDDRLTDVARLKATVLAGGYCIGCGSCAAIPDSPIRMRMDAPGRLQATVDDTEAALSDAIVTPLCPFSDAAADEDEIAGGVFASPQARLDGRIGWFREVWAGHVAEGDFRVRGSSGGMGNWLAAELLGRGMVDAVLHVRPDGDGRLFSFAASRSLDELRQGAKSRYYPIEMSGMLRHMREMPGRYALIGVPCFIKAARLQARRDPVIAERLRATIALVCGHLKSAHFAAMFAWQLGIRPDRIATVDFRVKNEHGRANQYSVRASGEDARGAVVTRTRQNKDFFGYLWSHGFFKYRACDYCDDVMGETADVTVGDAWLPGFVDDPRGTNVIVARSAGMEEIIRRGIAEGRLALRPISADDAAKSQDAGLRHRRLGLAVRLARALRRGRWVPPKRVAPGSGGLGRRQRWVYLVREMMSERSHRAFQQALARNDPRLFARIMTRYIVLHDWLNRNRGIAASLKRLLRGIHA